MSHRKVHSQGSIPFSWEDTPGVSKINHKECLIDRGLDAHNLKSAPSSLPPPHDMDIPKSLAHHLKIPLPPCPLQPPRRSTSSKGLRWCQEDPFLAAYKECTKSARNDKLPSERKRSNKSKARKNIFSCKNSCEVRDDNLVRLTNLPLLPKYRIRESRCE